MKHIPLVDLKAQYLSIKKELDKAISDCIEKGRFIGGESVKIFEDRLARYCDIPYCAGCGNGTDALEISLKVLGIGKGDEVIVPAMTFMASAEAVINVGADVKLCDITKDTYLIDPELFEKSITTKTKAVIVVHLYGQMAEMDKIQAIARNNNLFIIEDSAQAIGASYNLKGPGHYGDIATFSFFPGKNLGAYGDAGAMITKNEDWYLNFKKIANHGRLNKFGHETIGRNSRLDTLQASILSVKLNHLVNWTKMRQQHAKKYLEMFESYKNITLPAVNLLASHAYHLFVIKVDAEIRNAVLSSLKDNGIEAGIHYPQALHEIEAFNYLGHHPEDFPNAFALSKECISLPMYPELTMSHIEHIATHLKSNI